MQCFVPKKESEHQSVLGKKLRIFGWQFLITIISKNVQGGKNTQFTESIPQSPRTENKSLFQLLSKEKEVDLVG